MKKQSRIVIAGKTTSRGAKSSRLQRPLRSGITNIKAQYIEAMKNLAEINKDEISSIAAITERLSKVHSK